MITMKKKKKTGAITIIDNHRMVNYKYLSTSTTDDFKAVTATTTN